MSLWFREDLKWKLNLHFFQFLHFWLISSCKTIQVNVKPHMLGLERSVPLLYPSPLVNYPQSPRGCYWGHTFDTIIHDSLTWIHEHIYVCKCCQTHALCTITASTDQYLNPPPFTISLSHISGNKWIGEWMNKWMNSED